MPEILGIGELLIDFTPAGERTNPCFEMNPGGSAANCMAACAALGASAGFAGAVGEDMFGDFLRAELEKRGINASALVCRRGEHTTLAFVSLDENAVPRFAFIKERCFPVLRRGELDSYSLAGIRALSFSSVAFADAGSEDEVRSAMASAREAGIMIGFDANYRTAQWRNRSIAAEKIREAAKLSDLIKASDEEAELISGLSDPAEAACAIARMTGATTLVTAGERGAWYCSGEETGHVPAFEVNAADTTGCGDAFMGAMLYLYVRENAMSLKQKVTFASAAAAICASRFGGLPAMASRAEVDHFMRTGKIEL